MGNLLDVFSRGVDVSDINIDFNGNPKIPLSLLHFVFTDVFALFALIVKLSQAIKKSLSMIHFWGF